MDPLNDRDIGRMWAHYYPIRKNNGFSWNMCLNITYIAQARAICAGRDLNCLYRLDEILNSLCIPKHEFYQLESESKAGLRIIEAREKSLKVGLIDS